MFAKFAKFVKLLFLNKTKAFQNMPLKKLLNTPPYILNYTLQIDYNLKTIHELYCITIYLLILILSSRTYHPSQSQVAPNWNVNNAAVYYIKKIWLTQIESVISGWHLSTNFIINVSSINAHMLVMFYNIDRLFSSKNDEKYFYFFYHCIYLFYTLIKINP